MAVELPGQFHDRSGGSGTGMEGQLLGHCCSSLVGRGTLMARTAVSSSTPVPKVSSRSRIATIVSVAVVGARVRAKSRRASSP